MVGCGKVVTRLVAVQLKVPISLSVIFASKDLGFGGRSTMSTIFPNCIAPHTILNWIHFLMNTKET